MEIAAMSYEACCATLINWDISQQIIIYTFTAQHMYIFPKLVNVTSFEFYTVVEAEPKSPLNDAIS